MKTIIKGDEDSKQTTVTFVIDWSESNMKAYLDRIISIVNSEVVKEIEL